MEEEGVVVGIPAPGVALVKMVRSAACASCGACNACHSPEGSPDTMFAEAIDPIGVTEGMKVVLNLPAVSVLKASFVVYILPIVVLVVVGVLVENVAVGFVPLKNAQLYALLAALAALLATFWMVRRFFRKRADSSLRPTITSIV